MPGVQEETNKKLVTVLYESLSSKNGNAVQHLLAPDLEWWFHGPPSHRHHLIRLFTSCTSSSNDNNSYSSFVFVPVSIVAFGSIVIAEGHNEENSVSWVHAWTVTDGVITQVREYLNTSVTVTRFGNLDGVSQTQVSSSKCACVWQSKLSYESVPGLILAL
ncbi:Wound-induced protein 1 [Quillaja saponaria]|uniref:Wound-induced protein 1 n=1 Tax=Quillaja saponaria TaxID=32244 RepID=A0AAD7LU00_QUISA|nr:Wound-induced protein 1 [Quillaja saponaria]